MKFAAVILMLSLAGCASKPPCPVAQVHPVMSQSGALWFLIDVPNVGVVQELFRAVRDGDCAPGDNWAEVPKGDV